MGIIYLILLNAFLFLMTIRQEGVIKCSYCGGIRYRTLPAKHSKMVVCVNPECKAVLDFNDKAEDVKHNFFHETGVEPPHKEDV